jgi:hypothetical protein
MIHHPHCPLTTDQKLLPQEFEVKTMNQFSLAEGRRKI